MPEFHEVYPGEHRISSQPSKPPALRRQHLTSAKTKVGLGVENSDRGKLIMACGTGKTFTSLKIAEETTGKNKLILFIGPLLDLRSPFFTGWTRSEIPRLLPLDYFTILG